MVVSYRELEGSPKERITEDGMEAERKFEVAWNDRWAFCEWVMGSARFGNKTIRLTYPGQPRLAAYEISSIEPYPPDRPAGPASRPDRQINQYEYAHISVRYKTVPYRPPGEGIDWGGGQLPPYPDGTFLEYSGHVENQILTLPGRALRWVAHPDIPVPEDISAGIRTPVVQHVLTWSRVISPPWNAIVDCLGCTNNATFLGAPTDTLMFTDVQWQISWDLVPDAPARWRLTYTFSERVIKKEMGRVGWNEFYRETPPEGWWFLVQNNLDSIFPKADFNRLFQFRALGEIE